jgi:tetratricopeptide (TPR) repeat protein
MRGLLEHASLGDAKTANEIQIEPQPDWSEMHAELEREDLDEDIEVERRDLARGAGSPVRLRALRSLRAMRSFERGDHGTAFQEWQALFDEEPEDTGPLMTRATFFACERDFDTALADYDRAAAIRPDDPEIYAGRGRCFVQRDDWERALLEHRRLVHLRPRDRKALQSLASSLRLSGDIEGAIRVLGRVLKLFPWRAELYSDRAGCYRSKGLRAEELVDLDQCIARDPENAAAFRARAEVHSHFKDQARELADLTRAIELDPSNAGTFFTRALRFRTNGEIELSIADFSRAIELSPDQAVFFESRAQAYLKTGALDLALADLSRAMYLDRWPDADKLWLRGHARRRLGDSVGALEDYREAMELDQDLFDDLLRSERWHRDREQSKAEHRDDLDTLVLLAPEDPEYRVYRARIFEAEGKHEEALADLDQAIAIDPDRNDYFHARAMILINLGEGARAMEDESRAITLAPFAAISHAWRGTIRLWEEGASEEAEADLLRAVHLAPEDTVVLYLLASYFAEAGRHEEALRVHDQRIALHPTYGFLYAARGEARLLLPHDEATLRAALADFDQAIELEGEEAEAELFSRRAETHALLGAEGAARGDRDLAAARSDPLELPLSLDS